MIAILLIVATLIFVSIYIPNRRELISDASSLATRQAILEKDYISDGHTVDDPLIVLNPYEISPLTAIIAFETEKLVRPTIKINGKDEQTTLRFTFDISKKHVLPIYGLYADSDNVITISFDDFSKENLRAASIRQ